MKRFLKTATQPALLTLVAILLPVPCSAAILYEQPLAATQPGSPDFNPFSDSQFQAADDFTLTNSALGTKILEVRWYGSFLGAGDPLNVGATHTFSIQFLADAANLPGTLVATFSGAEVATELAAPQGQTQDIAPADQIYEFRASVNLDLALNTKYWISILGDPYNGDRFRWAFSGDGSYAIRDNGAALPQWAGSGSIENNLAFVLVGPDATNTPVPEPSSFVLFAFGTLTSLVAGSVRKSKAQRN